MCRNRSVHRVQKVCVAVREREWDNSRIVSSSERERERCWIPAPKRYSRKRKIGRADIVYPARNRAGLVVARYRATVGIVVECERGEIISETQRSHFNFFNSLSLSGSLRRPDGDRPAFRLLRLSNPTPQLAVAFGFLRATFSNYLARIWIRIL